MRYFNAENIMIFIREHNPCCQTQKEYIFSKKTKDIYNVLKKKGNKKIYSRIDTLLKISFKYYIKEQEFIKKDISKFDHICNILKLTIPYMQGNKLWYNFITFLTFIMKVELGNIFQSSHMFSSHHKQKLICDFHYLNQINIFFKDYCYISKPITENILKYIIFQFIKIKKQHLISLIKYNVNKQIDIETEKIIISLMTKKVNIKKIIKKAHLNILKCLDDLSKQHGCFVYHVGINLTFYTIKMLNMKKSIIKTLYEIYPNSLKHQEILESNFNILISKHIKNNQYISMSYEDILYTMKNML